MAGAGRYAELAAAVRSFKAELIQPNQIERLVETSSLSETINVLTAGRLTTSETSEIQSVESFLTQRAIELAKRLASYAPHDSRALIKLFSTGYELECVKQILKTIIDQVDPDEALKLIVPTGRYTFEKCKELVESRSPNRVIDSLEDEALKRSLAVRITSERAGMSAVFAIDQHHYSRLWAASNLSDPLDAQSARGLIGGFVDHMNILLAARASLLGLDGRTVTELFVPVDYALGHAFDELADSGSVQNLLRILDRTPYSRAFQGLAIVNGGTAAIERALNRSHAVSCLNAFAGSPFNVGIALAFLFLKNYELRDLFAIVNGKANNISAERIMDSLILRGL